MRLTLTLVLLQCVALAEAPKPRPLTEAQKREAITAALVSTRLENAVHRLDEEYRLLRERKLAEFRKAAEAEAALVERLRKESGAGAACGLSESAEWDCKK